MVRHRVRVMRMYDRVVPVCRVVEEQGTFEELMARKGVWRGVGSALGSEVLCIPFDIRHGHSATLYSRSRTRRHM